MMKINDKIKNPIQIVIILIMISQMMDIQKMSIQMMSIQMMSIQKESTMIKIKNILMNQKIVIR